jgi:hypothetical protein
MENQLIVYKRKKNIKKLILFIILGLLASIIIFIATVLFSASISFKNKNSKIDNSNLMVTNFQYEKK